MFGVRIQIIFTVVCHWRHVVYGDVYTATDLSLTTVPGDIPASATQIILSNNLYTTVDSGWFTSYSSLTKLMMADNQITTVAPDAFDSSQPINTVDFSNNLIVSLPDFRVLATSLHTIILKGNPLTNSPTDTAYLSGYSILWNYMIDNTNYQSLDPIKSMALNQFKLLRVRYANLSDIGTLETFNHVYFMDISYNDHLLPSLSNETFIGVDILESLHMAGLGFTEYPTELLNPVKDTLEHLTLSVNEIPFVNATQLAGYDSLVALYLDRNLLTRFPEVGLLNLTLQTLGVNDNDITYIPDKVLDGFDQLTTLSLGYNRNLGYIPDFGTASAQLLKFQVYGIGLDDMEIEQLLQFTSLEYIYPTAGHVFSDLSNFTALNNTLQTFIGNYGVIGLITRDFVDQMGVMTSLSLYQSRITCLEEVSSEYTVFLITRCPPGYLIL